MNGNLSEIVGDLDSGEPVFDLVEGGIELLPCDYFIEWERLDSYPKLAEWLCHISDKTWITTRHMHALIVQTEKHFKWQHHYNC